MDETIGMLSVAAVLVLGVWLVDYSGDATRASGGIRAASSEAAQYAADALSSPPAGVTDADLDDRATEIAQWVVGAAAIGACDTADERFAVAAAVHRRLGQSIPAAVSVTAICPLTVSTLFGDTVETRVAVPVAAEHGVAP